MNKECLKSIQFDILLYNPQISSRSHNSHTERLTISTTLLLIMWIVVGNYKLTLVAMSQRIIKIAKAPVQEEQSSDRQFSQ